MVKQLFELGKVVTTPGALEAIEQAGDYFEIYRLLARHVKGDWGELDEDDKELNNEAVKEGNEGRILSAYRLSDNTRLWIITEWDRSVTTVLLPEEY